MKIVRKAKVKIGACGGLYIGFINSEMQIDYLPISLSKQLNEGDKVKITIESV